MIRIDRILCPVDFSTASAQALEQAGRLAAWYGSSVTALHVWPTLPVAFAAPGPAIALPQLDSGRRQELTQELERAVERAGLTLRPTSAVVAEGDPVTEILRRAFSDRVDLIVMGTHGRTGLQRWLLGSVTESVLRQAPCPVLAVRASGTTSVSPAGLDTIVCAIDFSDESTKALEQALSMAQERRSRLVLLHVITRLGSRADEALLFSTDFGSRLRRVALDRLRALLPADAEDWCRAEACVAVGRPDREILRTASEQGASLIVMGAASKGFGLSSFRSNIRAVASASPCPLLVVPTITDTASGIERLGATRDSLRSA